MTKSLATEHIILGETFLVLFEAGHEMNWKVFSQVFTFESEEHVVANLFLGGKYVAAQCLVSKNDTVVRLNARWDP